ncbi:MAG: TIGR01244 family sulfur transferase [Paracoccus sp. (in: a-proteobacteria)]|nr:TIGR01244 family sulfur transferase [Paracoccus sp. (in: a-proteobacteria)]
MDSTRLTDDLTVAPQIRPEDMAKIAALGFRIVINNRPDGEIEPELHSARMAEAARAAGMDYVHIPYIPGHITQEMLDETRAALTTAPAFAYCRSGNRSTVLWGLAQAGQQPVADIVETAARAGYDISGFAPLIERLAD